MPGETILQCVDVDTITTPATLDRNISCPLEGAKNTMFTPPVLTSQATTTLENDEFKGNNGLDNPRPLLPSLDLSPSNRMESPSSQPPLLSPIPSFIPSKNSMNDNSQLMRSDSGVGLEIVNGNHSNKKCKRIKDLKRRETYNNNNNQDDDEARKDLLIKNTLMKLKNQQIKASSTIQMSAETSITCTVNKSSHRKRKVQTRKSADNALNISGKFCERPINGNGKQKAEKQLKGSSCSAEPLSLPPPGLMFSQMNNSASMSSSNISIDTALKLIESPAFPSTHSPSINSASYLTAANIPTLSQLFPNTSFNTGGAFPLAPSRNILTMCPPLAQTYSNGGFERSGESNGNISPLQCGLCDGEGVRIDSNQVSPSVVDRLGLLERGILSCSSCNFKGHPKCLNMTSDILERLSSSSTHDETIVKAENATLPSRGWRCLYCQVCEVCHKKVDDVETKNEINCNNNLIDIKTEGSHSDTHIPSGFTNDIASTKRTRRQRRSQGSNKNGPDVNVDVKKTTSATYQHSSSISMNSLTTVRCSSCQSVYHASCLKQSSSLERNNKLKIDLRCIKCINVSKGHVIRLTSGSFLDNSKQGDNYDTKDKVNLKKPPSFWPSNGSKVGPYLAVYTASNQSCEEGLPPNWEDYPMDETIPDNIHSWTCSDVVQYLKDNSNLKKEDLNVIIKEEIDGQSLMLVKRNDVINNFGLKLGVSLKLHQQILKLQTRRSFEL